MWLHKAIITNSNLGIRSSHSLQKGPNIAFLPCILTSTRAHEILQLGLNWSIKLFPPCIWSLMRFTHTQGLLFRKRSRDFQTNSATGPHPGVSVWVTWSHSTKICSTFCVKGKVRQDWIMNRGNLGAVPPLLFASHAKGFEIEAALFSQIAFMVAEFLHANRICRS